MKNLIFKKLKSEVFVNLKNGLRFEKKICQSNIKLRFSKKNFKLESTSEAF